MTQKQYGSPNTGTSGIVDLRGEQELLLAIKRLEELGNNSASTAYRKAALVLKTAEFTKVPLDTVIHDPGGNIVGGAYIAPSAGTYQVDANSAVLFTGVAPFFITSIFAGGVEAIRGSRYNLSSGEPRLNGTSTGLVTVTKGTEITLSVFSSAAGSELETSIVENRLSAFRVA